MSQAEMVRTVQEARLSGAIRPTAGRREIGSLTGIRGIAACYVVAYHLHEGDHRLYVPTTFLRHGYLAVDIFFVLSGLVMAMSYKHLFQAGITLRGYAAFLLRRLARVYPLYIAMLAITVVGLVYLSRHHVAIDGSLAKIVGLNILLVQTWGLGPSLNGPSWSISTELAAYLVFPWLLAGVLHRRTPVSLAAFVCIGIVGLAAIQPTPAYIQYVRRGPLDIYWWFSVWPVVKCIAEFTLGLLVYRVAARCVPMFASTAFTSIATVVAFLLLFVPDADLLFVCAVPLFLLGILNEDSPVSRVLASLPVLTLGRWSYAIYLWHGLLMGVSYRGEAIASRVLPHVAASFVGEACFWMVLLTLAALSFRYIEGPGRRILRGLEATLFPAEDRSVVLSEEAGSELVRDR